MINESRTTPRLETGGTSSRLWGEVKLGRENVQSALLVAKWAQKATPTPPAAALAATRECRTWSGGGARTSAAPSAPRGGKLEHKVGPE